MKAEAQRKFAEQLALRLHAGGRTAARDQRTHRAVIRGTGEAATGLSLLTIDCSSGGVPMTPIAYFPKSSCLNAAKWLK